MSSSKRARTALFEGEIVIKRPVEEVFDYVADERHEPTFNSRMHRADCSPRSRSESGLGSGPR